MAKDERIDSLELALKNEATERKFYLDHAQRTDNALGKAMFLEIADDELEHFQRLKELHAVWAEKGKWPETVPLQGEKDEGPRHYRAACRETRARRLAFQRRRPEGGPDSHRI